MYIIIILLHDVVSGISIKVEITFKLGFGIWIIFLYVSLLI